MKKVKLTTKEISGWKKILTKNEAMQIRGGGDGKAKPIDAE